MIKKYIFGTPIETEAVIHPFENTDISLIPNIFDISTGDGFSLHYKMENTDIIYGLGEANRGLNKRGFIYTNNNTDEANHLENVVSLYAAHNFIIIADGNSSSPKNIGLFFDYPSSITFDIGYTNSSELVVTCQDSNLTLYTLEGTSPYEIVLMFRKIIGPSYIPPKFAFGYGQSRWGYCTKEDFINVVNKHRDNDVPLDMVYMDIDYMEGYKDFTLNQDNFSDFGEFVSMMKNKNIHLIPIIDAGVKVEKGYDVYEEGVKNNYFCKDENGKDFVAAVWPGYTHLPDVLNKDAREWFGMKYKMLIDYGVDGFWNDMNEPALFYTPSGLQMLTDAIDEFRKKASTQSDIWKLEGLLSSIKNRPDDYKSFYHNVDGQIIRHDKVHNLYGYNMTRAASDAFDKICPNKRILMFSRSSYIGMHRYGGIWTGDNMSWWSHLLLNIKMMPSLNMCGFLYSGADLGGFGCNTTRDLLLRWLAFGLFTPLMRNHSAAGTREQEFYQFENIDDFKHIIGVRYRLIPYIYSEYMKAAINNDMYFKPLAFVYPENKIAVNIEDQLIIGNEIMIAPVYAQNAIGRLVYLPEEMIFVKFLPNGDISKETLSAGSHFVEVALNEVPLFIRNNKCIPVANVANCVANIDYNSIKYIGYESATYDLYDDDGITK